MTSAVAAPPGANRRSLAGAFAAFSLPIVLLVPFLEKAYHMDDTVYLWVARQIQQAPLDFYGFEINWYGTNQPVYDFNENPPGISYCWAIVTALFGWGEIATHLTAAVFTGLLGLGVYLIARRFTQLPLVATFTAILTPAVLVSGNTVMTDVPMLAYYVWAIYCWVLGLEREKRWLLAVAAILCAVSALHKYYGITTVPLLFAYSLYKTRRMGTWALYLLIPVAALAVYQFITYRLYGVNLFTGAAAYAIQYSMDKEQLSMPGKAFIGLVFTGGCMASAFFLMPWLWRWKAVGAFAALAVASLAAIVAMGTVGKYPLDYVGRYNWPVALHAALMFTAGVHVLALALRDFGRYRDADALLLLLWIIGAFAFSSFLNWSINARTILPMAPALGIVVSRALEYRLRGRGEANPSEAAAPGAFSAASVYSRPPATIAIPLTLSLLLSGAVLWGDWQLANAQRVAAAKTARDAAQLGVEYFYKGHWGFQYYMNAAGFRDWDVVGLRPKPGDRIVVPENASTSVAKINPDAARAWYDLRFEVPASRWISTMHPYVGAGFYTHFWGPLPYAFGKVPPEFYAVYELGDFRHLPPP